MAAKRVHNVISRARWSEEMEDLLVDWWQQYECLYNVSSDTYHNRAEKERCWEEIAVALDLPVEEVKLRAASLRTQYSRLVKPRRPGSQHKTMTARQRRIVTSLKFLEKHIIHRTAESNLDHLPRDAQLDSDELESTAFSLDLESGRSHSPAESATAVRSGWSVEKEDKFLELWQQHECLYNLSTDRFHDKFEREKKWAEIASALELPVEDVKTKASSLRTQYSRLVKPQGSGRRKTPMTGRQRRILTSCDFLKKYISHRANEDNLDQSIKDMLRRQQDSSDSDPENRAPSQDFGLAASPSPTESSSVSPPPPQPAKKQPKTQSKDGVERQKVALLQHMLDVIQETTRQPERDCEDSFGVTVAMELKRIRNQALRNRVKRQIMTILYDALDSEQVADSVPYQPRHTAEESHSITVVIP